MAYAAAAKGAKLSFAVTTLKTQASVDPVSPPHKHTNDIWQTLYASDLHRSFCMRLQFFSYLHSCVYGGGGGHCPHVLSTI